MWRVDLSHSPDTVQKDNVASIPLKWAHDASTGAARYIHDAEVVNRFRCLKTMSDWDDWQAYLALYKGNRERVQQYKLGNDVAETSGQQLLSAPSSRSSIVRGVTGVRYARGDEPYLGIAIRTFLAAYVQRTWGLEGADLSQAKLAAWLTEMGYSVKPHDVKNAGRTQLFERSVPSTPEVLAFFAVVKQRFPALNVEKIVTLPIS